MSSKIRINRFLASAGLGSRRKCEDLIRRGLVAVNGEKVEKLGILLEPGTDEVTVDGTLVAWNQKQIILVLNKPEGVLSTVADSFQRKTVIDLAREKGYKERLFPVGRLDLNTSGVLILTNDGDLAYRLTHPRFKIEKRYVVRVEGIVQDETKHALESGIKIGDFVTQPCTVRILERCDDTTELEVRLKEGLKRQIRRMFAAFGHRVIHLRRIALCDMEFSDVTVGEIRPLTPDEVLHLRRCTGLV